MRQVIGEPESGEQQRCLCPSCGVSIPSDPRFVTWCEACGWNVHPQKASRPRNLIEALYARMGQSLGKNLYEDVRNHPGRHRPLSPSLLLAFAVSVCVHLVTVVCFVGGVLLIVSNWFNLIPVVGGFGLLALAWVSRPRFSRVPSNVVTKESLPTWYRLAGAVAQKVGAPIDGIVLTGDFNAAYSQPGFPRRKAILWLGVPLLTVLDTEERVALLGHELAHGANGDPRRGFIIGSAVDTLRTWYGILRPSQFLNQSLGSLALLGVLSNLVLLGFSVVPWTISYILIHLLWRDSQRAEYVADRLAARTAGTAAVLRLLDALHLQTTFTFTAERVALSPTQEHFFAQLRQNVAALPERERRRLHLVERLDGSQLDVTHPPTAFRIDLITADPVAGPTIAVGASDARALDTELEAFEPAIQSKLVDRYRRRLYY